MTKDELEEAFQDWYFADPTGSEIHDELAEVKGYQFQFFGENIDTDKLKGFGDMALVTNEFPLGDVLYSKKIGRDHKKHGLVAIHYYTIKDLGIKNALKAFDGNAVELQYPDMSWVALIHRAARPGCVWQASFFDDRGPFSHYEAQTKEDAVTQAFEMTVNWEVCEGCVDEMMNKALAEGEIPYPIHNNPQESLKQLASRIRKELPAVELIATEDKHGYVNLAKIQSRPKKAGHGTAAMEMLTDWADKNNRVITLVPSMGFGATSVVRLKKFYKRFGFVENKGRNKDYSLRSGMYRKPLVQNPACVVGFENNPAFSGWRDGWWTEATPQDVTKISYRRKRDALNVFMDWNQLVIDEAFNGPSQKHPADSFDNFNHLNNLKSKRRIDTFAKAVWFSLPAGGPYYLEDINVNMLNETSPILHNVDEELTLPDYTEERRLIDQELEYWEGRLAEHFPGDAEDDEEVPF